MWKGKTVKKFFIDSAEIIIYASAACIFITSFYFGIQLIRLSGSSGSIVGVPSISPLIGIFVILSGVVFAALHCVIWFSLMDIRTYTRHSAKMLNNR